MIFIYIVPYVLCMEDLLHPTFDFNKDFLNDEDCYYNITYHEKIFSNSLICLFQCKFCSIKSNTYNAAVTISLRNSLGFQNLIYNCSFTDCSSYLCGAIFINLPIKSGTEIVNSIFEKNSANENKFTINAKAGAIYVISQHKNDIQIKNCIFEFNDSTEIGGAIH